MTPNAKAFFALFEDADIRKVLSHLEQKLAISDADSRLLACFAAQGPRYAIEFFSARVRVENANELSGYQAIPYELGELRQTLQDHIRDLLDAMAQWHAQDAELFSFRGGSFLASIFGDAHEEISNALIDHVRTYGIAGIPFVAEVLDAFNGDIDVTETCWVMVDVLPEGHKYLGDVERLLYQVGMTTGEHGLVEAYKDVRHRVSQWQADNSVHVKRFAENFLHSIEQTIASEQQAADERLQQRKLGFRGGESADDAPHDGDRNK